MTRPLLLMALALGGSFARADEAKIKGVDSVALSVEPAEAKPGQTVVVKLTVKLQAGFHTYPLVQPDEAAKSMVNKIEWPKPEGLVFVGEAFDPADPKEKAEPLLGIEKLQYFTGTVVFERKAVVSPLAKAGDGKVALPKFLLSVCDKDSCFPAKKLAPEAAFKVLDGKVEIEKAFAAEVEKALKK